MVAVKNQTRPSLIHLFTRDRFLFALGAGGAIWETVVEQGDRPTLLILFAACLGFPVFLQADERKKNGDSTPKPEEPKLESAESKEES